MTQRSTDFAQHPFQEIWKSLLDALEVAVVDDLTIPTSVEELARLKRVVIYIDNLLKSIDPDITPKSIWANFQPQATSCLQQVQAYESNKSIGHIIQANEHADNLLTYIKPYQVLPENAVKALQISAKSYAAELINHLKNFRKESELALKSINDNAAHSQSLLENSKSHAKKIDDFNKVLFVDSEEVESVDTHINTIKKSIEDRSDEIDKIHAKLLIGEDSTVASVIESEKSITEGKNKIEGWINTVSGQIKQLGSFHTKIFGEVSSDSNEKTGGLSKELEDRINQLDKLEAEQKLTHSALVQQVKDVLPDATNASLASAYANLKKEFVKPIELYTKAFYGSLLLLVFAAIVMSIQKISIAPEFSILFVDIKEWDYILKALLYKIPFIAPVIWLAIFSSTRRSQYERLQQEYAHKEALARSYDSYKKQILDLKGDSEELQRALITKAIDAIAYNASVTLDGKHEEKMPLQHLLDKLNISDISKLNKLNELGKKA